MPVLLGTSLARYASCMASDELSQGWQECENRLDVARMLAKTATALHLAISSGRPLDILDAITVAEGELYHDALVLDLALAELAERWVPRWPGHTLPTPLVLAGLGSKPASYASRVAFDSFCRLHIEPGVSLLVAPEFVVDVLEREVGWDRVSARLPAPESQEELQLAAALLDALPSPLAVLEQLPRVVAASRMLFSSPRA